MEDDVFEDEETTVKDQDVISEKPFPDDLEERLSVVVNAVNTELKIVTLLHLDDVPRDFHDIKARVRETRGRGYLPQASVFREYGETLHDIALVAKSTIIRDDGDVQTKGYSLTEAGKVYGVPVAKLALKWAVDNNLSMFSVLGPTNSKSKVRSPYNCIRILEELKDGEGEVRREVDLVLSLGLHNNSVSSLLRNLDRIGFVSFDSTGTSPKGTFLYRVVDGSDFEGVEYLSKRQGLTKSIIDLVRSSDEEFDYRSIAGRLDCNSLGPVSTVINYLERQGVLERVNNWKTGVIESKIKLLDRGRKYLNEFVLPVKEHLASGNAIGEVDFNVLFGEYVSYGIEIYRGVSPNINSKSSVERVGEIEEYLSRGPGATMREIGRKLNLNRGRVSFYLRGMKDKVRRQREGRTFRYTLR